MNENATLFIKLWSGGSVQVVNVKDDIALDELEEVYKEFVQQKINEVLEKSSWNLGVRYRESKDSCFYPHEDFLAEDIEDAKNFLNNKKIELMD